VVTIQEISVSDGGHALTSGYHRGACDRRSRTALVSCLLVFVGMQLGLDIAMDQFDPGLRDPEYGRKLESLKSQAAEKQVEPLLLALGTSRTVYGFRPTLPPGPAIRAFNFGITAIGTTYELICLRRLLEAGIRPDRLFIEILPPLLHQTPAFCDACGLDVTRLDWRDLQVLRRCGCRPDAAFQSWFRSRLVPCYSLRTALLQRIARDWLDDAHRCDEVFGVKIDANGWLPYRRQAPGEQERRRISDIFAGYYAKGFNGFEVSGPARRTVSEMLDLCRRERIDATVVLMPEGDAFRRCYSPDMLRKLDAYLSELKEEYCIQVVDARDWCDDSQFSDGLHLLPDGAAIFSARLEHEAIDPGTNPNPRLSSTITSSRRR